MVSSFGWICAGLFWILALIVGIHTIRQWKAPKKHGIRYSEIIEIGLLIFIGYNILYQPPLPDILYLILLLLFGAEIVIFLFVIILPHHLKHRNEPEFHTDKAYIEFLQGLGDRHVRSDNLKDLSRKILHILQYTGILSIHLIVRSLYEEDTSQLWNSFAVRNFIYYAFGGLFLIMMIIGDLFRMHSWNSLPDWGKNWFTTSLEPKREEWSFNSAVPIILANLIWISPVFPYPIFLIATWNSCISDAVASFIGKRWGTHKLKEFGRFPEKSWEGLIAGGLSSILGPILIFCLFSPSGLGIGLMILATAISLVAFLYVDLYSKYIIDNLLNSLLTGAGLLIVFILC